jgi:hypothetical protein
MGQPGGKRKCWPVAREAEQGALGHLYPDGEILALAALTAIPDRPETSAAFSHDHAYVLRRKER